MAALTQMDGLCSLMDLGVNGKRLRFRSNTSYTVKEIPTLNGQRRVSLNQNTVVSSVFPCKNSQM